MATNAANGLAEDGPIAVVGGTGLMSSSMFKGLTPSVVSTEHGDVTLYTGAIGDAGLPVVFIQRHHAGPDPKVYDPPHAIHHRASFAALAELRVRCIVAVCSVGGLQPERPVGTLVLPDDYFAQFGPRVSFYDDKRSHIVPGIDAGLRAQMMAALSGDAELRGLCKDSITYVHVTGPRFETPSEVRFFATLGDVIGMTAGSEATMAAELKIPYAMIAMIDNFANGVCNTGLTTEDFLTSVERNQKTVERAVSLALNKLA
jgi:5'-methylthioadenosine phosphorylase